MSELANITPSKEHKKQIYLRKSARESLTDIRSNSSLSLDGSEKRQFKSLKVLNLLE